jgi:hypothetical protein
MIQNKDNIYLISIDILHKIKLEAHVTHIICKEKQLVMSDCALSFSFQLELLTVLKLNYTRICMHYNL